MYLSQFVFRDATCSAYVYAYVLHVICLYLCSPYDYVYVLHVIPLEIFKIKTFRSIFLNKLWIQGAGKFITYYSKRTMY